MTCPCEACRLQRQLTRRQREPIQARGQSPRSEPLSARSTRGAIAPLRLRLCRAANAIAATLSAPRALRAQIAASDQTVNHQIATSEEQNSGGDQSQSQQHLATSMLSQMGMTAMHPLTTASPAATPVATPAATA